MSSEGVLVMPLASSLIACLLVSSLALSHAVGCAGLLSSYRCQAG